MKMNLTQLLTLASCIFAICQASHNKYQEPGKGGIIEKLTEPEIEYAQYLKKN